jgi:hypothetical protein
LQSVPDLNQYNPTPISEPLYEIEVFLLLATTSPHNSYNVMSATNHHNNNNTTTASELDVDEGLVLIRAYHLLASCPKIVNRGMQLGTKIKTVLGDDIYWVRSRVAEILSSHY